MHVKPAIPALSLALVIALTGCTSHVRSAPSHPAKAAHSTPAATTVSAPAAPLTHVALSCDDTLSANFLAAGFTSPLKMTSPTRLTVFTSYQDGSTHPTYHVRSLGGIDCAWWNDQAPRDEAGDVPYATVRILPAAAAEWKKFQHATNLSGVRQVGCGGDTSSLQTWCSLEAYANGYWVSIELNRLVDDRESLDDRPAQPLVAAALDLLMSKVESLPAGVSNPPLFGASLTMSNICDGILPTSALATALGSSKPIHYDTYGAATDLYDSAVATDSQPACTFALRRTDQYSPIEYGHMGFLPGGAWAAAEDAKLHTETPVTVPGLQPGDSASTHMGDLRNSLVTDLVIGGNWIEFTLYDPVKGAPRLDTTRSEATKRILAALVANLERS